MNPGFKEKGLKKIIVSEFLDAADLLNPNDGSYIRCHKSPIMRYLNSGKQPKND